MELEEMQATWSQMSDQLENQKRLTNKLIMEMTKERYKNKIGILSKYEGIGSVICFIVAILLISRFSELDTWYLLASGIFTILYLIILPVVVLLSISDMKSIDLTNSTYKDTFIAYTKKKRQFLLIQKTGIYLNFILLAVSLPVVVKVFKGKDIFITNIDLLYWYIPIMAVFLILFSIWGYAKYKRVTDSASHILEELEDTSS
ncbi:hypothetical protein [Leeuwenhoekiella marinoflava]|uniref:Uncharacterized protein n=2 Tax=Leeuwenhoekiella marinoflava TaxID=988 RepID=A0A4Q0PQ55_9FLAO|nr:hypothetical protein [Leeuwenhoekiella marinoflava]RXG32342.1 hypothetical protein DSL99_1148 [Leeuwenhoekiella marinoflava]SHE78460.1 hypothetical protein SAMN02745246_01011 [Leeuwenhoekiella marinoflava DSM 3653]